ncbi:MAG: S41 family peptidase [Clostridium sp.]|nr:S41 family peptidase [Prevotella sp.]MCM1428749.1 S41 family peptidase [Clostridium sp.]MCM1475124.1 S41 family peptidase [Muribaculaceae bacterium]
MSNKRNLGFVLIPAILALGVGAGIFIGKTIYAPSFSPSQQKLLDILDYIDADYVDSINTDSLLEKNFSQLISLLDPHSAYIPASELTAVNEDLDGNFSGVGVSFQILNDTVHIIEIVAGGPSERVGLQAGDIILKADTFDLTGSNATNENVYKYLRGKKGTKVKLSIKRSSAVRPLSFVIERGDVPVNSVDSKYMIGKDVGYIRVNKFSRTTYDEFHKALDWLVAEGAKSFVIDLRGNSGGYMDQAVLMANEFLPADRLIVYTKGKNRLNQSMAYSDGTGDFQDYPLAVLTDEFSASASEIFAGAMQDNDRGLVVGRRSFGKGLVQNQNTLFDNSGLRLTVARYYTPSGRSIQKEYVIGEGGKYDLDISDRYAHGEFYSADSIKLDRSKLFHTIGGRNVFGGGGIMPDIFVPSDTVGMSSYYISVSNAGLIQKYAYKIVENYRSLLMDANSIAQVMNIIPRDNTLLTGFVNYAAANGVPARWFYIRKSEKLLLQQLKAIIVRDVLGYESFIQVLNENDNTLSTAVEKLRKGVRPIDVNRK